MNQHYYCYVNMVYEWYEMLHSQLHITEFYARTCCSYAYFMNINCRNPTLNDYKYLTLSTHTHTHTHTYTYKHKYIFISSTSDVYHIELHIILTRFYVDVLLTCIYTSVNVLNVHRIAIQLHMYIPCIMKMIQLYKQLLPLAQQSCFN